MKSVRFNKKAEIELLAIGVRYQQISAKLSAAFTASVESAIDQIQQFPAAWPESYKGNRKCLVKTFPYAIIYKEHARVIRIAAIAHFKRKPAYWAERV